MRYRYLLVWVLALSGGLGCATSRPDTLASDPASELRQARIEYRSGGATPSEVSTVAHNQPKAHAPGPMTTIEYPHPSGDQLSALVTVVETRPGEAAAKRSRLAAFTSWADHMLPGLTADERIATAKGLKISKQQLDDLLRELVREGGLESTTDSQVAISVQINGWSQDSHPHRSPTLERLTQRVKSEGELLSTDHPHVVANVGKTKPSDGFYRAFQTPEIIDRERDQNSP